MNRNSGNSIVIDSDENVMQQVGNHISIQISSDDFKFWQRVPNCLDSSMFLTSLDVEQIDKKTYEMSTELDPNQNNLEIIKDNILADSLNDDSVDFVTECVERLLIPTLQIAYAQQQQKTWNAPLHPANLVIDSQTDRIKSIFRYPQGTVIDQEFVNDLTKIIYYLLIPLSSEQLESLWSSRDYITLTEDDFVNILGDNEIINYVKLDTLQNSISVIQEVLDNLKADDELNIEQALEYLDAQEAIDEVNNTESVVSVDTPDDVVEAPQEEAEDVPEEEPIEEAKNEPEEEPLEEQKPPKKKAMPKKKGKKGLIIVGSVFGVIALIALVGMFMNHQQKEQAQQQKIQQEQAVKQQQPAVKQDADKNSNFLQGLTASNAGDYENAVDSFNQFFDNKTNQKKYLINKNEKITVYVAYSKLGKYQQLLNNLTPYDKMTPVTLTNYLLTDSNGANKQQILKLNSSSKYINFAKAYLKNDNNGMIEYANADLSSNQQMAVACGHAYGNSGDLSGAKDWLQSLTNNSVQKQATQAVIQSAQSKGMNPDQIKKTLNVND